MYAYGSPAGQALRKRVLTHFGKLALFPTLTLSRDL